MKINLLRLLVFTSIITPGVLSSQNKIPFTPDKASAGVHTQAANSAVIVVENTTAGKAQENNSASGYLRNYFITGWNSAMPETKEEIKHAKNRGFSKSVLRTKTLGTYFRTALTCTATITPYGPTTFCQGGSVVLHASNGNSWLWSTGATTQNITVNQSGTYYVTVTAGTCCATAQRTVTVNPNPTATITPNGPTTFCQGGSVILTASTGSSYLWSTGATTQSITVNSSGTYTVSVTNANGCSGSASRTVVVTPNPPATITPGGPTTFCQVGSVVLTASNGSSYLWSTGATTQSITANSSGTYSVTVNNGQCSSSATVTVTVNPNPTATITPGGPTTFCQGGSVTLTASAGATWLWSTGATTQSITAISSGTYSVIITNASGCTGSATIPVTVNPNPTATITPNGPTTFCQGGSVVLHASNGTSWLWSTGATTQNITVNSSGSYSVTVSNGQCTSTATINVTVNPNPTATITPSGPTTFCQGGSVILTASAGASWLWSTGATTQSITATSSGTYSVIITNASGCTGSASIIVTVNPNPTAVITPNGPTTFCQGGSVILTASAGASWLWSTGATTQSITVTTSGTYSVIVTNANGCSASCNAVQVTVLPNPQATITPNGPTTFCQGGSVVLHASNGTSWLWSTGAITQDITVNSSGTYSVTVSNGQCTSTATINVTVNPNPTATITPSGPTTFCQGGSVILTASAGASWLWSTGATTQNITATSSGTYSVLITNASGCTGSATISVTVNPNPTATITPGGPTTFCQGGSVVLHASSGTAWVWSTGAITQDITVNSSGTYSVTVSNGQCTSTATINVTVSPSPVVTITPNGPTTFCQGGSVVLTASAGSSYTWSTGATTQSITATTSGSYSVVATNGSGCTGSASIIVIVNPNPVAVITPDGPTTFCQGDSVILNASTGTSWLWSNGATTQSITATTSGNYSVTVTNANGCTASSNTIQVTVLPAPQATITPNGPTSFCAGGSVVLHASNGTAWLWSTGATTQNITATASGIYSVTISNGICTSTASITVTEYAPVVVTVTPDGPTTFCQGDSVILTASNGASYQWSTGATTQSITVINSGTYSVMVTDSNGCTSTCNAITVTVLPNPQAVITGPTEFCAGDSIVIHASNGTAWIWSTGAITQNITVYASGTYSVTISNGICTSTASITVTEFAPVAVTITPDGPTTFCEGDSVTLTANNGSSYIWNTGDTTQSIVADSSGMYHVMVTDSNGCMSACYVVYVNVIPNPQATIAGTTSFCQGDSAMLHASSGTTYMWSTGDTTQDITVYSSGTYTVTVSNGQCTSTASITVTEYAPVAVTITPSGPTSFCQGDSVILTANNGASYIWNTGDTTQSIVADSSGMYHVMVTDSNGCMSACYVVYVTVFPTPVATITPDGPTSFCSGDSVQLTASMGTSYLWSNGDTTQSIVVDSSGTYSVVVADSNGCSASASGVLVTVLPAPIATITPDGPTSFCNGDSVMLTANQGTAYMWSTGATTQSITVYSSGTYSVTVGNLSCSSSDSITITEFPLSVATATPDGPTTFCTGDSVMLTASNGSAYLWSNGDTTQSIVVYTSGNYSVAVTDTNGCSANSNTIAVTVNPAAAANITPNGPTTFCNGDSVLLSASTGTAWLWSTGATTQSITAYATGIYSVIVANGVCSGADTISVTEYPASLAVVTPNGPTTLCTGDSVMLTASNGSAYLWSNGDTTQSIVVYTSGNYSVAVTDTNGCSANSNTIAVTVNPAAVANITPNGPTTFCNGDSVLLSASTGTAWLWSTGATTQSITAYATGIYSVIVANGVCSGADTISVTEYPVTQASVTANGPTTFCMGDSVTLTANAASAYLWSTGATTQSITVYTSGNYSVNTTDANGCTANSNTIAVTVNPAAMANITPNGPTTFCQGDSVTLSANTGTSYLWSTGAMSQAITVYMSGTYSVTVGNGACSATATATVNVIPVSPATIMANGPLTFCEGDSVTLTANSGTSYLWSNGSTSQSIVVSTSGNYSVSVGNGTCSATATTSVLVLYGREATITPAGPLTLCEGDSVVLTASNGTAWLWSTGETTQSIVVNTEGNYSVNVSGSCGNSTSQVVVVNVNPSATTAGFTSTFQEYTYTFTNTSVGATNYQWTFGDNNSSSETNPVHMYGDTGTYLVTLIASNGCGSDTITEYIVVENNPELTGFFNGFSPNGDGHNDWWNIPMLENYPTNNVLIINRWGNEVWKADNYNNTSTVWTGRNMIGEELPDGTYYFIIQYNGEQKRGWVFIKR